MSDARRVYEQHAGRVALLAVLSGLAWLVLKSERDPGRAHVLARSPERQREEPVREPALLSAVATEQRPDADDRVALEPAPTEARNYATAAAAADDGREASPEELARLVRDLADDDVPGNATAAHTRLFRIGPAAVPALEQALGSRDLQQRLRAASLLRILTEMASPRLLDVTVESLGWAGDELGDHGLTLLRESCKYLEEHAQAAQPRLLSGLGSADGQLRYYCAVLLARMNSSRAVGRVCDVLMNHLSDNAVQRDATLAAQALDAYAETGWHHIVLGQLDADEQRWNVLRRIELRRNAITEEDRLQLKVLGWQASVYFDHSSGPDTWSDSLPYGPELAACVD